MRYKWSIAVYEGSSPFSLQPVTAGIPTLIPKDVTDIACDTVADPFLLRRDGHWYLFFEAMNTAVNRGEIGYATSNDCLKWTYQGIVLREDFHLSYPYVFEHEGTVYMIPETRQADGIFLYAASDFPQGWKKVAVLQRGPYADSSIFFKDGLWWMFTQRGQDEMRIFYSDRLETGWTEHPRNPVWAGNRVYSRPGGRILKVDGSWYRFAQDGVLSYGDNLRAQKIDELTRERFREHEIAESPILRASLSGWNALAMHHLDAVEMAPGRWLGVVDGATINL